VVPLKKLAGISASDEALLGAFCGSWKPAITKRTKKKNGMRFGESSEESGGEEAVETAKPKAKKKKKKKNHVKNTKKNKEGSEEEAFERVKPNEEKNKNKNVKKSNEKDDKAGQEEAEPVVKTEKPLEVPEHLESLLPSCWTLAS